MNTPFPPDRDQIARFVDSLFRYAETGTFVRLSAFDQFDGKVPPFVNRGIRITGNLEDLVAEAVAAVAGMVCREANVFAPPICTFGNGHRFRTSDLTNGLVLSVELDAGDTPAAQRKLEDLLGPATMVVASGSEHADPETGVVFPNWHIHWRLSEATADADAHLKLSSARELAARLVGADPTGKPIVHPLRWPGSWNRKLTPRLAFIVAENPDAEIDLDEARDAVAEAVEAAGLASVEIFMSAGTPEAPASLVASAMAAIPNAGIDVHYDDWMRFGYALYRATGGSDMGRDIWNVWASKSDKYNAGEQEAAWKRVCSAMQGADPSRKIGAGTIFFYAKIAGWTRPPPEPPPNIDDPGYWNSIDLDAAAARGPEAEPQASGSAEPTRILDPWNSLRPVVFPIDALPEVLRKFVENRANVIGADPCAIAWTCLSACSAAIHGGIRLRMKRHDTWSVPPALWVALIGAPSTKKSPVIDAAWAALGHEQSGDLGRYRTELARWESLPKNARESAPKPDMVRRLVSHDSTMEALQDILAKQSRGIGVLRDELAGWIGSMEKYAPGRGGAADRAFYLQSHNGGPHIVDRVQRGVVAIDNLLIVMCGGIQPDRLRQFSDLTDDGLWQRFVPVIVGPGAIGHDIPPDRSSETYSAVIGRLLQTSPDTHLVLSEAAHAVREDVQERIHRLEQAEVLGARFTGFCGKLVGLWGRLCLVLHLVADSRGTEVSGTTAEAARTLLFGSVLPNAARVYTAMGGAGGDLEATQSIAGYILTKRLPRIIVSDLTSSVRVCRNRSMEDVRKLLSPLEAGGWLKPEKDFNPTSWRVPDDVHVFFAERAAAEAKRRRMIRSLIVGAEDGDAS